MLTQYNAMQYNTACHQVQSATPQPGVAKVLIPGEPEEERRLHREKHGITIDSTSWQQLVETAQEVGLDKSAIPN